jgi:histone deacetylase 11
MIIDLDAHQGNGHEIDFMGDPFTYIIDFYNHFIYPGDGRAAEAIADDVYVDIDTDS